MRSLEGGGPGNAEFHWGEVLPKAARRFGDKTALVIEGRSFSFRDLDELSDALAGNLVKLGVKPGDRVTLYAPNSWEWIVSYYGALKTVVVINPVNVMLTPAEVAYVTKDCGAKVLIGSPEKIAPASCWRNRTAHDCIRQTRPCQARQHSMNSWLSQSLSRPYRLTRKRFRPSATPPAPPAIPRAPCSRTARWPPTDHDRSNAP